MKWFLYISFLTAVAAAAFLRPEVNFDRLPYAAVVVSLDVNDIGTVDRNALAAFGPMPVPQSPYFSDVASNPYHLGELEPLYAIKPYYVITIHSLWHLGASLSAAIRLASALPYIGLGLILAFWTRERGWSALLMMTSGVISSARTAAPDAMSTMIVFLALWAMSQRKTFPACALLLFSVWIRTDNVILCVTAFVWMLWNEQLRGRELLFLIPLAVATPLVVDHYSGAYGWRTLMYSTFVHRLNAPGETIVSFGLREYFSALFSGVRGIFTSLQAPIWFLIGYTAYRFETRFRSLLILATVTFAMHFVLFPNPEERYLVWTYLIAGIALVDVLKRSRPGFIDQS